MINICLASDNNYAKYLSVTAASILANAKKEDDICFYILDGGIEEDNKNKILSFINRYEEESIIRNIALKWRHKFRNSNGKVGNIAVGINMINSTSNFSYDVIIHHIYQQFGINRERINHVIRFISDYSK